MNLDHFFENNRSLEWIGKGIILFWAMWSLLVALTDSIDWLQQVNLLSPDWAFTSGNFELLVQSLAHYKLNNHYLNLFLYFVIVIFAWIITIFFVRAVFSSKKNIKQYLQRCYAAFLMSLAIEAFFIIVDEIFIQYPLEHGHMDRLGFKLVTFIVFFMLERHLSTGVKRKRAEP